MDENGQFSTDSICYNNGKGVNANGSIRSNNKTCELVKVSGDQNNVIYSTALGIVGLHEI